MAIYSKQTKSDAQPNPSLIDRVKFAPEHLRAARGLLNWSREDLQAAAGVSMATIKNIELGVWRPNEISHAKIINAFAAHGVEFVWLNGFSKYGLKVGGVMKITAHESTKTNAISTEVGKTHGA